MPNHIRTRNCTMDSRIHKKESDKGGNPDNTSRGNTLEEGIRYILDDNRSYRDIGQKTSYQWYRRTFLIETSVLFPDQEYRTIRQLPFFAAEWCRKRILR